MAGNPTAAYRAQQGLSPVTQSYDPVVAQWTRQAAAATGADPVAMLATEIQETGARRGAVGDQGSSFGPFQHHVGGALGAHTAAWANSYAAVLERAKQFARLKIHGGVGAAALQRPADQALYAQGVQSHLAQARAILGRSAPVPATPGATPTLAAAAAAPPTDAPSATQRSALLQGLLTGSSATDLLSLVQQAKGQSPQAPAAAVSPPAPGAPANSNSKVVAMQAPKIIGTPYHGTHNLGNWESDNAVDIAMPTGTPIYAPFSGVIGSQIGSLGAASGSRFAGQRVHLAGQGNELYFAHLSRLAVRAGEHVTRGQVIGYSGSANGVQHLHLGAKVGNPGVYA